MKEVNLAFEASKIIKNKSVTPSIDIEYFFGPIVKKEYYHRDDKYTYSLCYSMYFDEDGNEEHLVMTVSRRERKIPYNTQILNIRNLEEILYYYQLINNKNIKI